MTLDDARAALLQALDELDDAVTTLGGEPERVDLVVIYSIGRRDGNAWRELGGWSSTTGPKWTHAAMLRRAADAQDEAIVAIDDDDE